MTESQEFQGSQKKEGALQNREVWVRNEYQRIEERSRVAKEREKSEKMDSVFAREILRAVRDLFTEHFNLENPEAKITLERKRRREKIKKATAGDNIPPLEKIKALGQVLRENHNPLFVPILLATEEPYETVDLPEAYITHDWQRIIEKRNKILEKGGFIRFPDAKRTGTYVDVVHGGESGRKDIRAGSRNTVRENDKILYRPNSFQIALAMLQPTH